MQCNTIQDHTRQNNAMKYNTWQDNNRQAKTTQHNNNKCQAEPILDKTRTKHGYTNTRQDNTGQ